MDKCRAFDVWLDKRLCEMEAIGLDEAFYAGWQSRQAEINKLQSQINEMAEVGLSQESVIREKDKRIESALSELESLHNKKWAEWKEQADMHSQGEANAYEHAMQILEKTLRGEYANS